MGNAGFAPSSRYAASELRIRQVPGQAPVVYLARRLVPRPDRFATLQFHRVTAADRLDRLAARWLGDPLLFWLLCDANAALRPEELTETIGRSLRITLPEGIPGGIGD